MYKTKSINTTTEKIVTVQKVEGKNKECIIYTFKDNNDNIYKRNNSKLY